MKKFLLFASVIVVVLVAFLLGFLASRFSNPDLPYETPGFALDGSVAVPAFRLPSSQYMSEEATAMLKIRAAIPMPSLDPNADIEEVRAGISRLLATTVASMKENYPVSIEESVVAGVPVRVFLPAEGPVDPDRILINLHGGAFSVCWDSCSILESAPIAALGGFKVISVNYRMAPEAVHPAGVEDVISVYRELNKQYDAGQIGIYGCSAGGALSAQTAAMIPTLNLDAPGAIGIFGAGGVAFGTGDSAYVAAYIDGSFPPPVAEGQPTEDITRGYFANADKTDAIISPALHPDVLAKFPPTLITTGTRAMDMSPAVYTNSQLINAGVKSTLIVAEGMGHCFQYFADFPETREVSAATVAFFKDNLGR